jgi:mannose/fructose/N-acetylgalactosamine-specific phosphotransferase system component IIC
VGAWVSQFGLYFLIGFLSIFFGSGAMEAAVNSIPTNIINALNTAGNLLPAVGFGLLLTMIMDKKVAAWFFIGFILTAYLGMPTIAVTLLATAVVVLLLFARGGDTPALSTAAEEDDNEF